MARNRPNLTSEQYSELFRGQDATKYPPIITIDQLSDLLGLSRKTVELWKSRGHLDGAFRKRGKHVLILRDLALKLLFEGKDWASQTTLQGDAHDE